MSKPGDVRALATYAAQQLGGIDVWYIQTLTSLSLNLYAHYNCKCCVPGRRINNAGTNSYKYAPLPDFDDTDLINVVETNMLGVMLGCREVSLLKLQLEIAATIVGSFIMPSQHLAS